MTILRFLILLVFLITPLHAKEFHGANFPEKWKVGKAELVLNGVGIRQYSIFKVNVYVAGLYLEKASNDEGAVLNSTGVKHIRMHFLRDVTAQSTREGWREYLKDNATVPWGELQESAEAYLSKIPDIKEGQVFTHDFYNDRVVLALENKVLAEISGKEFSRTCLSTWIGKKPSTEKLKAGLLGFSD